MGAILRDQQSILTVCTPVVKVLDTCDVTICLPYLVGVGGVLASFPLPLSEGEAAALQVSAEVVCQAIEELDAEAAGESGPQLG